MNKQEFLDALWQSLSDLPQDDVSQSLEYYEEMLDDRMEDGLSEEEAVAHLGSPREIAERIRLEMPLPTLVRARAANARRPKAWEIVLLILGSPVWLPILISVAAILFSLYIVIWSVLISFYAVVLAQVVAFVALVGFAVFTFREPDVVHATFLLGGSFISLALAILLFLASVGLTLAVCRGTAALVRSCKKRVAGKGSAA